MTQYEHWSVDLRSEYLMSDIEFAQWLEDWRLWCDRNLTGRWRMFGYSGNDGAYLVMFEFSDAALFRLRWSPQLEVERVACR